MEGFLSFTVMLMLANCIPILIMRTGEIMREGMFIKAIMVGLLSVVVSVVGGNAFDYFRNEMNKK